MRHIRAQADVGDEDLCIGPQALRRPKRVVAGFPERAAFLGRRGPAECGSAGILHDLAEAMVNALPDGPELTAGLRKLLEAKDCFVRAALDRP